MRVLILRPDHLGDVVLFTGALRHVRAMYPNAEIVFCGRRYVQNLLELCPHVDRFVPVEELWGPIGPGMKLVKLSKRWRMIGENHPLRRLARYVIDGCYRIVRRRTCRQYRSDVLLVPVRSPAAGFADVHELVRALPAAAKIGIAGDLGNQSPEQDRAAEASYTRRLRLAPDQTHRPELAVTADYLSLLSGKTITIEDVRPEFWTGGDDRQWALEHVIRTGGTIVLGLCPGVTSLPGKCYPAANYAEALRLCPQHRFSVVIFGAAKEADTCAEVARAVAGCPNVQSVCDLAGRTSVRQLVEALRRTDVVLSQETAALHIATALDRPTVGIVGGGHFGRFYPWGDRRIHRAASVPMDCFGCNWQCKFSVIKCIQEIPPPLVAEELRSALAGASLGGP